MKHPIVILALLAPSGAHASDVFVEAAQSADKAAADRIGVKWSAPGDPQALARTLVRTKLLATLHAFGVTPKSSDGALDLSKVSAVGSAERGDRRYAFVAIDERLKVVFMRRSVPVELDADTKDGWSAKRLRRRREVLSDLSAFGLKARSKDRYGNVFTWVGRAPSGRVFVRYVPEDDEMIALFVSE